MFCVVCNKKIYKGQTIHLSQKDYLFCKICVVHDLARRFDLLLQDNKNLHQEIINQKEKNKKLQNIILSIKDAVTCEEIYLL